LTFLFVMCIFSSLLNSDQTFSTSERRTAMKYLKNKKLILGLFVMLVFMFLTFTAFSLYDTSRSLYEKIELFGTILRRINYDYVDEKDPSDLLESAIKGMVSSLDPHTNYLSSKQYNRWNQSFEGYSGIGITFDIIRNKITVMSVFKEGPSEKVGLQPGDRIVKINGESAIGMKRDDVPLHLMGPKGTTVDVEVERSGWDRTRKFTLVRDEIHVESVPYAFMLKPGLGYIKIARFSATTGDELEEALDKLEQLGMTNLVLDLRQNGGGYLDAAVAVTDKFLTGGKKIVYTNGRTSGSLREYYSTAASTHPMMPLMVLIDRTSASASEIVSGALQDWDRALIVGETSFGKGLVQSQYRFRDGSVLLMTTAKYYTPVGRLIQRAFDDKSVEEYYTEVFVDSLRQHLNENKTSDNIFKSELLGRIVYGGGGITPDKFLKADDDTISHVLRDIYYHAERPFFTYVEDYLKDHSNLKMEMNDFILSYHPGPRVLDQFYDHLQRLGITINHEQFKANEKDIQFLLKQAIANKIWGSEAQFKVQMLRDNQLVEALNYLPDARILLSKAYSDELGTVVR